MKPTLILLLSATAAALAFGAGLYAQKTPATVNALPGAWNPYAAYPVYTGTDLGVTYTPAATTIRVWSPPAEAVRVRLYGSALGGDPAEEVACTKGASGVWAAVLKGDRKNQYYTVSARIAGQWNGEYPDPWARAVGTNGLRGQIIDLRETNPPGWDKDKSPALKSPLDAIIYELHVRDLSMAGNSGIRAKGKFLAFTETESVNSHKQATGISHIADLGVTHVHLLPAFDFNSVDESKPDLPQFNWGYDPLNYNVPEGSYATDAADGKVRIREFKEMVQAMHGKGLRVVMDVVYNHTARTRESNFDQLVPGYWYRQWEQNKQFSNGSGCGNETASDRPMVRKFIVESVVWWAREYHVDGFRFDLMGLHDLETMNQVSAALHAINPSILIYGEGWTAGDSPLPEASRAIKAHAKDMNGVAVFSDDIRDAVKGSVFDDKSTGFASGSADAKQNVMAGIVAATDHPQIEWQNCAYAKEPYAKEPSEVINYVACHDNQTLYDKLKTSRPDVSEADIVKMHKLANTIVFTSQGIPFLHAGEEMKRSKGGEHNSYNKPDSVNRIDWDLKFQNRDLYEYYKALIALRKAHPAFRMPTADMIREKLVFLDTNDPQLIVFQINNHANGDPWSQIMVILNGAPAAKSIPLPGGSWKVALKDCSFNEAGTAQPVQLNIAPISALILYQE